MAQDTNTTTIKRPLINRHVRFVATCITKGCDRRPQEHGILCEDCARHAELLAAHQRRNGDNHAA